MEVEDRDVGARGLHLRRPVRDVHRNEVPAGEPGLGLRDQLGDVVLPLQGDAAEVRLVRHLEVEVVEGVELGDDLPGDRLLDRGQVRVLQRVDLVAGRRSDPVRVVARVHRAGGPEDVLVEGAEEVHLHDDAALLRLGHEVLQASEVRFVPAGEVELHPPVVVARHRAARPRGGVPSRLRGEGVVRDAEGRRHLPVRPREEARQVQAVLRQRVQVAHAVEVEVQDGPVMLSGGDEHGGFPAEEEVARVVGVQGQGRAEGDGEKKRGDHEDLRRPV